MTRRLLGPVGGPIVFFLVAALVFGGLGWVTVASLRVEQDQRDTAAQAERVSKLQVALWRLDGYMFGPVGVENSRPFYHYLPPDPDGLYGPPSPILAGNLDDWMRLHFQIDPQSGWQSPQVMTPEEALRLQEIWAGLTLRNVTRERADLLADVRQKYPTALVVAFLSREPVPISPASVTVVPGGLIAPPPTPMPARPHEIPAPPAPDASSVLPPVTTPPGEADVESFWVGDWEIRIPDDLLPFGPQADASRTKQFNIPPAQAPAPQLVPPADNMAAAKNNNKRGEFDIRDQIRQKGSEDGKPRTDTFYGRNGPPAGQNALPGAGGGLPNNAPGAGGGVGFPTIGSLAQSTPGPRTMPGIGIGGGTGPRGPAPATPTPAKGAASPVAPGGAAPPPGVAGGTPPPPTPVAPTALPPGGAGPAAGGSALPAAPGMPGPGGDRGGSGKDESKRGSGPIGGGVVGGTQSGVIPPGRLTPPGITLVPGGFGGGSGGLGGDARGGVPGTGPGGVPGGPTGGASPDKAPGLPADPAAPAGAKADKKMEFAKPEPKADPKSRPGGKFNDGGDKRNDNQNKEAPKDKAGLFQAIDELVKGKESERRYITDDAKKLTDANEPERSDRKEPGKPSDASPAAPPGAPPAAPDTPLLRAEDGTGREPAPAAPPPVPAEPPPLVVPLQPIPPITVHLGSMRAQWITADDGTEYLVLVRAARLENKTVYQGVILDWARLQEVLKGAVTDLFPDAKLLPVKDQAGVPREQAMTSLPVQLDPGTATAQDPVGWTPLRFGLVLAWAAAIIAFAAVGLTGWSLIDLAERRFRFVSAVTHELRTPLTSLRLYLDLLLSGMVQDEQKRQEYLATLDAESDRLHRLIDNVLDYARLEKRRTGTGTQPIKVCDLLEQVRQTWVDRCGNDGKQLVVISTLPPHHEVCTDPHLVQQIVGNLIDNARKYTRDVADPRIWLWARPGGRRWVVFEVEDRGAGVPKNERKLIFRPFRRGEAADTTAGGAGLGLALAKQWAELLGGRLSYRPADGGVGACFRLELRVR